MATRTLFKNDDYDGNFDRTLYAAMYGAADLGEAFATGRAIRSPTPARWHQHWHDRAEQVRIDAENSRSAGHLVSARDGYLRASEYYRQSYFFLRGDLTDTRLLDAYAEHRGTFGQFAELLERGVREVAVPYRDEVAEISLHGWLFSPDAQPAKRPTLVLPCGYDSTAEAGWCTAAAALERGYNLLSVEGPGQGASLYLDHRFFRPDAEVVYGQIMDWLVAQPQVDATRIAMVARSFAGYLGPRAVAADPRYAALVCDPAQPDMGTKIPGGLAGKLAAPVMTTLSRFDADRAEFFGSRMAAHGLTTIAEYLGELPKYTMIDLASGITCPTLIIESAGDPVGGGGQQLYDAIGAGDKKLVAPPAASGLAGHCGGLGQKVWERIVFDWLDATFATGGA